MRAIVRDGIEGRFIGLAGHAPEEIADPPGEPAREFLMPPHRRRAPLARRFTICIVGSVRPRRGKTIGRQFESCYFDVRKEGERIVLIPVDIDAADKAKAKLDEMGISEKDVEDAVAWARR
jgi:hypothetical protein